MSKLLFKEEVFKIIGACMEVHNELGSGFLEAVYHESLCKELAYRKIPFEPNKKLKVSYKGEVLNKVYYADILCFDSIIIELKAMEGIAPEHEAQTINYLKATGLNLGLIVNFGTKSLQYKRIIYTK